ncbi:MAG TPA: Hsp20/alpha crystallin family protein [Alphaproteobacteria bacterium]|nr:Hsp20/alpha crystallin family protein [Alphaproteobacteria bacterium]
MRDLPRREPGLFFSTAGAGGEAVWRPQADIYRTQNGWVVKLELAGVQPDDITIWTHGSRLTVSGSRRDRVIAEGWSCYAMEISYSHFERSMDLPFEVEAARLAVECRDGMLLIHVATEGNNA